MDGCKGRCFEYGVLFFLVFADENDYGLFWLLRLTGIVGWLVLYYYLVCVLCIFVRLCI